MSEKLYVIKWKATKTGAEGCSTKGFPQKEAQGYAERTNREDEGLLIHWIAAMDSTSSANSQRIKE